MSKYECKVCGNSFELLKENWYLSSDKRENAEKDNVAIYDTFDCPVCGCQNVIQERKRKFIIQVPPKGSLSCSVEQETTCAKENCDNSVTKCFGNMLDPNDADCTECKVIALCMEEHKSRHKNPKCYGKYDDYDYPCTFCLFSVDCAKDSGIELKTKKPNKESEPKGEQPQCLGSIFDNCGSSESAMCGFDNCEFKNSCVEKSKKPECFGNWGVSVRNRCSKCYARLVCKEVFDL